MNKKTIEQAYNIHFDDYFKDANLQLMPMQVDGLVKLDSDSITVTSKGTLFIRNICMCFDAYLNQSSNRFSKVL